ncbi:reverse transcriptase (RNA-dependent DNA polymerase) domain-containing protein [Phthorimaea operculella]|nr:reverse transcriptase (RNA-dependent DNA polymerase) domain-containing protein [Phthorimaea operculella]
MKLRDMLRETAEDCLKTEKIVPRKSWLTTDIIDLMIQRRQIRNKTDTESINQYKKLTNKITLRCREEKEDSVVKLCDKIEEYMQKGQIDKAYNTINQLNIKHKTKSTAILNESGQILLNNNDILERWKGYIEKLYEGQGLDERDIEQEETVDQDSLGPKILKAEFHRAIHSIQNGKASGDDRISIEMFKYTVCDSFLTEVFNLIQDMYMTGIVPRDFQITKTVTIPKKSNTLKCEEHRTLSLVSQASKILLKIIQNRIRPKAEEYIGPDQYGFRQSKGTREAILALRIIIDRRLDLSLNTHIAFIDLEKAFDKVDWKKMMSILKTTGLDYRDRRIIYQLYKEQETIIEIGDEKRRVNEKRALLRTIENRRGKMIGHLIRHDHFLKNIVEGKVEGRRRRGRPRRNYFEQIKEKVRVVSYQQVKSLAERRLEWRLLHRQEPSS